MLNCLLTVFNCTCIAVVGSVVNFVLVLAIIMPWIHNVVAVGFYVAIIMSRIHNFVAVGFSFITLVTTVVVTVVAIIMSWIHDVVAVGINFIILLTTVVVTVVVDLATAHAVGVGYFILVHVYKLQLQTFVRDCINNQLRPSLAPPTNIL